jgi:hypothetical protein
MNPTTINGTNAADVARAVKDGTLVGPATVRRSVTIGKLAMALCSAQGEITNPVKNKQNRHFENWYADLGEVLKAVLPTFTKNKLSLLQLPCELDGEAAMTTLLMHESGEWIESVTKIRPTKNDPQSVGSAQSYARRYALQALACVAADDDDDGNAASRPAAQHAPAKAATKTGPTLAEECAHAVGKVTNREQLGNIYRQYDEDVKAGKFTPEEKQQLDMVFKAASAKYPAPPKPAAPKA